MFGSSDLAQTKDMCGKYIQLTYNYAVHNFGMNICVEDKNKQ